MTAGVGAAHESTPVLIVGGGPVGLALAAELGWRGISCTLIEKLDGTVDQPKMDLVGVRTMEFCRRWGIASWVEQSPYPRDYPQDYVYLSSLNGYEFQREPFPSKREERRPLESPQKRERCPQDMFDPILARFVRTFPHVKVEYQREMVSFAETEGGVTVVSRCTRTGAERVHEARYLAGCDGAASLVRETLGIRMQGQPVLTYTTNVILRCPDFERLHDKGRAYRFIFIGPEGTYATIVAINGGDCWRLSIVGSQEKKTFSEAEIRAIAHRAMGRPFDFEILSVMPWTRRELVAERYGSRRVFLVGDAAHLMSPTGGFGMNTGIQEAVDLGWKLEGVLKGWGGPDLLASYEIERKPVAERNVAEASDNLRRMLTPREQMPSPGCFEDGPEGERARALFGGKYSQLMRREWFTLGIHLGYSYAHSPIVCPDGTPEQPPQVSTYTQTSRPGARAPHVWINQDQNESTLDLFGRGFVLLQIGANPPAVDGFVRAAGGIGLPLEVVRLTYPGVSEAYQSRLVLVRPDGHVCWRGDWEPDDPRAVLDIVRGAGVPAKAAAAEVYADA